MKVILLEKISGLGDIGSVIKVRDGFARNYLIPHKKVLRATDKNKAVFEQRKAVLEKENLEKKISAESRAVVIEDKSVAIIRQAGEDGRLYGSVTARDIAKAVTAIAGFEVVDDMIIISERIKNVGIYDVMVMLHADVTANIKVNIARSEQEAEAALKAMELGSMSKRGIKS